MWENIRIYRYRELKRDAMFSKLRVASLRVSFVLASRVKQGK